MTRQRLWRLIPKRFRNVVLSVRQRRRATLGAPTELDREWLDVTLASEFPSNPISIAHAPIYSYKEGSAYRLWIRFGDGRVRRLVFKNARLDTSSYPAIAGFPGRPGLPEWFVLSRPTDALSAFLPELYSGREVIPGTHYQYLLEDLSKSYRNVLDDDDAKRAIANLTAVHRALALWGEATGYAPMIDLGPDSAIDVIDYVERALRQFAEQYEDETVSTFLGRWGEIGDLINGSLGNVRRIPIRLIHGDFNRRNVFLGTRDREQMKLVDWEWMGAGPAHADLASVMKWSPWEVQRNAVRRFFASDSDTSPDLHWEVYLWCRLERSLLDAALHANQNTGGTGYTLAQVPIHLRRADDVIGAIRRHAQGAAGQNG